MKRTAETIAALGRRTQYGQFETFDAVTRIIDNPEI
jgi:hypothetical protein